MRVIIIEDKKDYYDRFVETIKAIPELNLSDFGITSNLQNAKEKIDKSNPEIILLDHQLTNSGNEGLEIAKYVREKDGNKTVKIISTTDNIGHNIANVQKMYSGLGVSYYTAKYCRKIKKALLRIIVGQQQEKITLAREEQIVIATHFWKETLNSLSEKVSCRELTSEMLKNLSKVQVIVFLFPVKTMIDFLELKDRTSSNIFQNFHDSQGNLLEIYDQTIEKIYRQKLGTKVKVLITGFSADKSLSQRCFPGVVFDTYDFLWGFNAGHKPKDFIKLVLS